MGGGPLLIVSLGTTLGWQTAEQELAASLQRLGVAHRVSRMRLGAEGQLRRTSFWPLVDGLEALACRRALRQGLEGAAPGAVIFLSTTAALLAPVARLRDMGIEVAVRVDCPAAVNRPGPQNGIQRALERRRLGEATLAVATGPLSAGLLTPLAARVATVPVPVEASPGDASGCGSDVVAYAADPEKKGLDLICAAWWRLGRQAEGRRLLISGVPAERGRRFLLRRRIAEPPGLEWTGVKSRDEHLASVRSAAAYVSASNFEEAGVGQLEALAAGTPLATTPSRGAYEAYPIVERIGPELAAPDRSPGALARSLAAALAMDGGARARFATAARDAMRPFSREAVDRALSEDLLPVLLP